MTKKEKEILFKAIDEAWTSTKRFKKYKDEASQDLYRTYRSKLAALYDLCDKLGVKKEYADYRVQQKK